MMATESAETPKGQTNHDGSNGNVLRSMWHSGLWRFFPFVFIYSTGFAVLYPVVPSIVTNGFASQAAGYAIDCEQFSPEEAPTACRDAHAQVVTWNSWTSFVSGSILSFMCAPAIGRLSDLYGRKPFLTMGVTLALVPMLVLLAHTNGLLRIEWYFPSTALGGMCSSFSMAVTSVADLMPQGHRASAVGWISSFFSVGVLIGPGLGGSLAPHTAVCVCTTITLLTLTYILVFVPECAPRCRKAAPAPAEHLDGADDKEQGAGAGAGSSAGGCGACCSGKGQLQAPLLARSGSGNGGDDDVVGGAGGGDSLALDMDPVPNVVPLMHEHTLMDPRLHQHPQQQHHKQQQQQQQGQGQGQTEEQARCDAAAGEGSAAAGTSSKGADAGGQATGTETGSSSSSKDSFTAGLRIILGSPWYRRLVLIWVIVSMTWEGSQDMLMQYLQLRLNFTQQDNARLLITVAACGLVIKIGLLSHLVRWLGEQRLLAMGLCAYCLQVLLISAAPQKWCVLAAVAVGSFSCVCWPAAVALQTQAASPENIGAVTGALQGISSLADGAGPVFFASLFSAFTRSDSRLPFMPEVVWYVAAGLTALAVAMTFTLHRHAHGQQLPGVQQQQHGSQWREEEQQRRRQQQQEEGDLEAPLLASSSQ